jgi:hypothetical protein
MKAGLEAFRGNDTGFEPCAVPIWNILRRLLTVTNLPPNYINSRWRGLFA